MRAGAISGVSLATFCVRAHWFAMSKDNKGNGGKAAFAGAVGSAALAAALLYANRRKERKEQRKNYTTPLSVPPETD